MITKEELQKIVDGLDIDQTVKETLEQLNFAAAARCQCCINLDTGEVFFSPMQEGGSLSLIVYAIDIGDIQGIESDNVLPQLQAAARDRGFDLSDAIEELYF